MSSDDFKDMSRAVKTRLGSLVIKRVGDGTKVFVGKRDSTHVTAVGCDSGFDGAE